MSEGQPVAAPVDLSAHSFWAQPHAQREAAFARLLAEAPISWQRQPETVLVPPEDQTGGYSAVVRYEDVRTVSRDPELFCSGRGVMFEDAPQEFLDAAQSFLPMDDPKHAKIRGLVSKGFAPCHVRTIEDGVRVDARTIVDELEDGATGDFVERVAKRLPLMTIMRMLGVPEADRERLVHQADAMVSWNDPGFVGDREPLAVIGEAIAFLHEAATAIAADRPSWSRRRDTTYGGRWVVNPSGGLISKGHPLGATGLAQCSELTWQLQGEADKRQVDGAKVGLQHNIGLGGACVVSVYKPAD
jgi:cytochrome P450